MKTQVRLPLDLHEALVQLAQEEDRSLNAQIVRLLRQSLEPPRRATDQAGR